MTPFPLLAAAMLSLSAPIAGPAAGQMTSSAPLANTQLADAQQEASAQALPVAVYRR